MSELWKSIVAGGSAGLAEISVMYPTDVMKTRAQLSTGAATPSMMQSFKTITSEQGFMGLYRGVVSPMFAETPKRAWKFTMNEFFKTQFPSTPYYAALSGALAGGTEAFVNCPFETIKVRMQARENLARYSGTMECLISTLRKEGVPAVYKGLEPLIWRNAVWNGAYFGIIGVVRGKYPLSVEAAKSKSTQLGYKFSTGVVGSICGTLLNTPFDVVKSRMQQQGTSVEGGEGRHAARFKYRNAWQSLSVILREEGWKALYKGIGPRLVRLGPGGGIMIVAFDGMMELLKPY